VAYELAFKHLDKNKDELLTKREVSKLFQQNTEEEADAAIAEFDEDGNGKLDNQEFKMLLG
jgi:Ca2+-binding EF-hand superfamily protein